MAFPWHNKTVLVTGGSAGLGKAIAAEFASLGAQVAIAGRDRARLEAAVADISSRGDSPTIHPIVADVQIDADVAAMTAECIARFGKLDILVNNVGQSARGRLLETSLDQFRAQWELNFLSAVRCTQAAAPHLIASRGHIVNIGSLAAKSASRYLGAYAVSKFPVAAFSQQLRLELADVGVHVLLVCPGPIQRPDAGERYLEQVGNLPDSARKPGGGVKLKGLPPDYVARRIVAACARRKPELILPAKARFLFALSQMWPSWGDWIIKKMT